MCYNKESSAGVFIYAMVLIGVLWWRNYPNDHFMAFFCLVIALIQATEYVMWSNPECNRMNHAATVASALIILAQPLVVIAGMTYYRNTVLPVKWLRKLVWVYAAVWAYTAARMVFIEKKGRCTKAIPGKHLAWDYNITAESPGPDYGIKWFIWLVPFFLFLAMKDRWYGVMMFALLIVTLVFSLAKGMAMERASAESWRSLYCFIGNSLPLWVLILGYVKRRRK